MKTLNIGLIGTGFMGKGHSVAFKKVPMIFNPPPAMPNLAVVADVSEELAQRAAANFGFERWSVGWENVVNDPSIDVIDITTPNYLHKEIALAAAKAGKHIYCEKPLALTAADAKEMMEAAQQAGVKTLVGFNYLKNPATLLAREIIEAGELGEIYHFRGSFLQDILVDPLQPFSWRFDRAIAGSGALGDLGAHIIEIGRALVGDFARVSALTKTFIPERPLATGAFGYDGKAALDGPKRTVENEDAVHFLIEFDKGATGVIESSRIAAGHKVFLSFEVNGSKGSLYFVHERLNELKVYYTDDRAGRQGFRTILAGPEHPHYKAFWPVAGVGLGYEDAKVIEVFDLLDGVANDKPIYPDFYAGWKTSQIVDAVLRSAQERQWVTVSEV